MAKCEVCQEDKSLTAFVKVPIWLMKVIKPDWKWNEEADRLRVCYFCKETINDIIKRQKNVC